MKKFKITSVAAFAGILLLAVVFSSSAQTAKGITLVDSVKVYTVKWCLYEEVPIPCPDAGKKDEFGRVSQYGCLVYHCRIDVKCDSMQFVKPKEAYKFYAEALKESSPNLGYKIGVQDVKIDSVWINNR